MSHSGRRGLELAAAFGAAILASGTLLALGAAPEHRAAIPSPPRAETGTTFSLCSSNPLADTPPDPAWVLASYENDNCRAPRPPAAIDGGTATREQVVAAMAAEKAYAAQARAFEACISDFVAARNVSAATPAGKAFLLVENHRILTSEKNRKRVSAQVVAAIEAFNMYGIECSG